MIDQQPEIRFPPHIVVWPQFSGSSHAPQTSSPAARWVTPTSETLSTPHCSFQRFGLAGGTLEHFDMGGSPAFNPALNITDKHGTEGGRLTDSRRGKIGSGKAAGVFNNMGPWMEGGRVATGPSAASVSVSLGSRWSTDTVSS